MDGVFFSVLRNDCYFWRLCAVFWTIHELNARLHICKTKRIIFRLILSQCLRCNQWLCVFRLVVYHAFFSNFILKLSLLRTNCCRLRRVNGRFKNVENVVYLMRQLVRPLGLAAELRARNILQTHFRTVWQRFQYN